MLRRFWDWLWYGKRTQLPPLISVPDLTKRWGFPRPPPREMDKFSQCYHCGDTGYYEGPAGGLSMNITCAGCGARYNVYIMPDGLHFGEELSGPVKRGN